MTSTNLSLEIICEKLDNAPIQEWEEHIDRYQDFLSEQLNIVSLPYRTALMRLDHIRKEQYNERVRKCQHDFERFCEYHNDVYFICRKCGFEK